jgi:hypothetical protein
MCKFQATVREAGGNYYLLSDYDVLSSLFEGEEVDFERIAWNARKDGSVEILKIDQNIILGYN